MTKRQLGEIAAPFVVLGLAALIIYGALNLVSSWT
jgi:hypothetical protein